MELSATDRDFFRLVSQAAFVNPFSEARDELDFRIAESEDGGPELIHRLMQRVETRLSGLYEVGELSPDAQRYDDWRLLEHAIAFEVFHRFADDFDSLIEAQLTSGSEPAEVVFADEAIARMLARGIAKERALRFFALFWQMRRAWYFITGLTGESPCMRRLRQDLWNDVFTEDLARYERLLWNRLEDFSVILQGETGTGKGQAAAAIGRSGYIPFDESVSAFRVSFTELLVPINLSQFPESLIESELFGHRKGAFTGAVDSHAGVFSRCSPQGMILLDEIGEVSIPVQIKLLRVLQDRVFTPVGSHEERRFEGRVVAATHRDLGALRAEGRFRDDFYYRLCSDVIVVPSLRQRLHEAPGELEALLNNMVERIVGRADTEVVDSCVQAIRRDMPKGYGWPGNVRELEQTVRRVLLTGRCRPDHRPPGGTSSSEAEFLELARSGTLEARELTARYCVMLYNRVGTYEEVARITGLDRRTVRKYVRQQTQDDDERTDAIDGTSAAKSARDGGG